MLNSSACAAAGYYDAVAPGSVPAGSSSDLAGALRRIDGKGYKAYKDIQVARGGSAVACCGPLFFYEQWERSGTEGMRAVRTLAQHSLDRTIPYHCRVCSRPSVQGAWAFSNFTLFVDWVQGDAYASPSRCRCAGVGALHALLLLPDNSYLLHECLPAEQLPWRCYRGGQGLLKQARRLGTR